MAAWKEEIRRRLEAQSRHIENILNRYRMPAVVTGGAVYARVFEFTVQGPTRRVSHMLPTVQGEMAAELNVPGVEIVCREEQMMVRVTQWDSYPLNLLELMKSVGEVRPLTSILGASADGSPMMLHLPGKDVSNILVVGSEGAGKTSFLRALLFSLAARNKQHKLQAVVIDYDPAARFGELCAGPLAAFSHLPHLVEPVAATFERAVQALDFLMEELAYRLESGVSSPKILLVVDNLDGLLAAGQESVLKRLMLLLQDGKRAGIHPVLALEKPAGPFTGQLLKCGFAVRFVGRVGNKKMARAAAGVPETGVELLQGEGDFIALSGGESYRFQTAYISEYDLYLAVERLCRPTQKKLVVKTIDFHPAGFP